VEQMKKGAYNDNRENKKRLQEDIDTFNHADYPLKYSKKEKELSCTVFGHMCPVFIVGEPFTETPEFRKVSRDIPRKVIIGVVRRDNSSCQICGRHLLDNEITGYQLQRVVLRLNQIYTLYARIATSQKGIRSYFMTECHKING
jgi:hypothetical protein